YIPPLRDALPIGEMAGDREPVQALAQAGIVGQRVEAGQRAIGDGVEVVVVGLVHAWIVASPVAPAPVGDLPGGWNADIKKPAGSCLPAGFAPSPTPGAEPSGTIR